MIVERYAPQSGEGKYAQVSGGPSALASRRVKFAPGSGEKMGTVEEMVENGRRRRRNNTSRQNPGRQ